MTQSLVRLPYPYFPDLKGRPLFNGMIYVGLPDLDPTIPSNQKIVTSIQEDGTEVPLSQPISTGYAGLPVDDDGNIVALTVDGAYSLAVYNKYNVQQYYSSNVEQGAPVTFDDKPIFGRGVLSDALSDESLTLGSFVITTGFTTDDDGGGALYTVVSSGVDDGILYITKTDGSGLLLKRSPIPEQLFETVSDMVSCAWLGVGDKSRTNEYSTGNLGGSSYIIRSSSGDDDGGSILDLDNGNQAFLIPSDKGIIVESFNINSSSSNIADQLYAANAYANSVSLPLIFRNDTNYTSTENLLFTEKINWISNSFAGSPPTINITESGGIGIKVYGESILTTTLDSDIPIWGSVIDVGDTSGVSVGDLMGILSDTPFYGVPVSRQGEIKKGHLCRISSLISSTQVRVEAPINDSYSISNESISIEFLSPVNGVCIDNISVKKQSLDTTEVGLELEYCYNPTVKSCNFYGAQGYGLEVDKCYSGLVSKCYGEGALFLYQFRNAGSFSLVFDNLTANNCNKAVDLSGLSIPCRAAIVQDCNDNNGGVDENGSSFFLQGTGFGSHWGVDGAIFRNCRSRDRFRAFYQRGISEKYYNCVANGGMAQSPFQIENPKDVSLISCEYNCEFLIVKDPGVTSYAKTITDSDVSYIPDAFCYVVNTDGTNECYEFSIKGCRAYGVNRRLVKLNTSGVVYRDFEITDNYAYMVNISNANDICVLESDDNTSQVYNVLVDNNRLQTDEDQTNVYKLGANLSDSIKINQSRFSSLEGSRTYLVSMPTDNARIIQGGSRNDGIQITIRVDSVSGYYASGILYKDGTFNSFGDSNFYNGSGFLNGTTGGAVSENTIGISFTGSRVYIQNRTGSDATVIVKISSPI